MTIQFEILEKHPEFNEDELFSRIHINAIYNNEPAGFVSVIYVNSETYEKKLKTPLDYFVYKIYQGHNDVRTLYENRHNELLKFVQRFKSLGSTYEDILDHVNDNYSNQYEKFINYWVNKPSRELTYVYDGTKSNVKSLINGKFTSVSIEPKNFRKIGIGKALLEKSMEVVNSKQLSLWESNTKTIQGNKFWQVAFDNFNILNSKEFSKDFPDGRRYCISKN